MPIAFQSENFAQTHLELHRKNENKQWVPAISKSASALSILSPSLRIIWRSLDSISTTLGVRCSIMLNDLAKALRFSRLDGSEVADCIKRSQALSTSPTLHSYEILDLMEARKFFPVSKRRDPALKKESAGLAANFDAFRYWKMMINSKNSAKTTKYSKDRLFTVFLQTIDIAQIIVGMGYHIFNKILQQY